MPLKVAAYRCEFGCGRRVTTDRADVLKHEQTCFRNPARRACKTCRFEEREDGDWYCTAKGGPGDDGGWLDDPAWLEARRPDQTDAFIALPSEKSAWPPRVRWGCPGWEPLR
jgi:hypothetical protein